MTDRHDFTRAAWLGNWGARVKSGAHVDQIVAMVQRETWEGVQKVILSVGVMINQHIWGHGEYRMS